MIPKSEPIAQWVVDKGRPSVVPSITENAVANYAEKPFGKSSLTTFLPTVSITFYPSVRRPRAMAMLPLRYA